MSKQPPPAPTVSTICPCPTISKLLDAPALEVYPGPSHHPTTPTLIGVIFFNRLFLLRKAKLVELLVLQVYPLPLLILFIEGIQQLSGSELIKLFS